MEDTLRRLLRRMEVCEPVAAGGLQMFGLRWPIQGEADYLPMDEALAAGTLEVTEASKGGSVPEIKIRNKGDERVFLMAGEQLVGGKQNRMLNVSLVVPARSELRVPVSCVEAGRWSHGSRNFCSGHSSGHGRLRAMMSKDVSASYRVAGKPSAKQGEVWGEVSRKLREMGSNSASDALAQAYADHGPALDDLVRRVQLPDDCCGVAFARNGRIAGADLFQSPRILSKLLPKLVKSHALDAMEGEPAGPELEPDALMKWFRSSARAEFQWFESPGMGTDVRIRRRGQFGASLWLDDHSVHTELFNDLLPLNRSRHQRHPRVRMLVASNSCVPRVPGTATRPLRVLIVDSDPEVRNLFRTFLGDMPDMEVVATADTGNKAVRLAAECRPDVIMTAIAFPGRSIFDCVKEILSHRPETRVLFFTGYQGIRLVAQALQLGARGFLYKPERIEIIADAIRTIAAGGMCLPGEIPWSLVKAGDAGARTPARLR
jgi:CheY-like chemotaxis protein